LTVDGHSSADFIFHLQVNVSDRWRQYGLIVREIAGDFYQTCTKVHSKNQVVKLRHEGNCPVLPGVAAFVYHFALILSILIHLLYPIRLFKIMKMKDTFLMSSAY